MRLFVEFIQINYKLDGTFKKEKGFYGFILIEILYTWDDHIISNNCQSVFWSL